jgi:hypothetical protein
VVRRGLAMLQNLKSYSSWVISLVEMESIATVLKTVSACIIKDYTVLDIEFQ